jgi:hypothetical protein
MTCRLQMHRTFTLVCSFNTFLITAESQTRKLLRASDGKASVIHQPWISSVCSFHCLRGKPIQEIYESTTTGGTAVAQLIGTMHHNTKGSEFDFQDSPWKFLSDLFFCPLSVVLGSTQIPKRYEKHGISFGVNCGLCAPLTTPPRLRLVTGTLHLILPSLVETLVRLKKLCLNETCKSPGRQTFV